VTGVVVAVPVRGIVAGEKVAVAPVGRPVTEKLSVVPTVGTVAVRAYAAVPPGETVAEDDPLATIEKLSASWMNVALVAGAKFASPLYTTVNGFTPGISEVITTIWLPETSVPVSVCPVALFVVVTVPVGVPEVEATATVRVIESVLRHGFFDDVTVIVGVGSAGGLTVSVTLAVADR